MQIYQKKSTFPRETVFFLSQMAKKRRSRRLCGSSLAGVNYPHLASPNGEVSSFSVNACPRAEGPEGRGEHSRGVTSRRSSGRAATAKILV